MAEGGGGIWDKVRRTALAVSLIGGSGFVAAKTVDIMGLPKAETDSPYKLDAIDTSTYRIEVDPEGEGTRLILRQDPTNHTNALKWADVRSINGTPVDVSKPFYIKNSPVVFGRDPSNGAERTELKPEGGIRSTGDSPWLAFSVDLGGLTENRITRAFVNAGPATENHIEKVKEGEFIKAKTAPDGHIIAVNDSGEQLPADSIGQVSLTPPTTSSQP